LKPEEFEKKRNELEALSEEELNRKFWNLADKIVDPLIELSLSNTSPSIERSVLLRMGFNSLEAKALVDKIFEKGMLGHGAGNILLKVSSELGTEYFIAGKEMINGNHWDLAEKIFKGVK